MFQHSANFFANVVGGRLTKPGKIPGGWINNAHEHAQRCRFAATIRSKHAEYFTSLHLEVKVINSAKSSKILGELLSGKYRFQNSGS